MITDILYRCPQCGTFDWLSDDTCKSCGAYLELISRTDVAINGDSQPIASWYDKVIAFDLPKREKASILESKRVRLFEEAASEKFKGFAGVTATHYTRKPIDEGVLYLSKDRLVFSGDAGQLTIPVEAITSLTIESDTIIVVSRGRVPLFFDFLEESGKKWEDCMRKVLADYYQGEIIEYYPRIRLARDFFKPPRPTKGHLALKVPVRRWYREDYSLIFAIIKKILRTLIGILIPVRIEGLENIPETGPAVVLPNHCSFLDSIILGCFSKRNIWFMAKNSEYKTPIHKYLLKLARSFPVRRYTMDVVAVRNAVRIVQERHVLGIFPEGERCWDNRLLPFKFGTIRLLLALGSPVIPVGIAGAYALMPRWTSTIKRVPVTIRIGAPISLGHVPIPAQTRMDVEMASEKLRRSIQHLLKATP